MTLIAGGLACSAAEPLSDFNRVMYGQTKIWILQSAEKLPEENYGFRPTDAVRNFGAIIGHVADVQYRFCSLALGEKNPASSIERSKSAKADLIAALKESFAYCDRAYGPMTDAAAVEIVNMFGRDTPKLGVLTVNSMHTVEHYGNLVTYLRLKNIVPPSTETPPAMLKKK